MAENEEKVVEQSTETNYIEVIKNLKNNTVAKSEYERVVAENKTLAEAFATSAPSSTEPVHEPQYTDEDIMRLSKRLENRNLTNLDFINTALEMRDAVMAVHGIDPFLPQNSDYVVTDADVAKANEIADGLRQMAQYADGDHKLFNSELRRCCK